MPWHPSCRLAVHSKLVKILPLILFAFGLMQTFVAASTNATIYISTRTDRLPGSGTAADPFNGSTEPLFDALMNSIAPNTTIDLSAGTFLTNGADAFLLKSGWTINGSGMGVTILKLAGHVDTAVTKHGHFWGNSITNLVIANLTCDGNYQGYNWPAHQAIGGMFVNGCTNGLIDHVEMINCYGDGVDGLEQFSIVLSGLTNQPGTNLVIQNCVTHDYAPGANYTFGCGIAFATDPQIINCRDDGSTHAFGFSGTTGAKITGCTTTANTWTGFYTDTSSDTDLTIEDNTFKVTQIPIQFNSVQGSDDNVKILNNILESANPTGSGDAAIVLSGTSGNNFQIIGNIYIYTGPERGEGLILNNQENFTDLDVEDNSSNFGLTGGGGGADSVTDTTSELSGNHFNESIAELTDDEQSSPANDVAATTDSPAPANFGSSSSSQTTTVASTPTPPPAVTPTIPTLPMVTPSIPSPVANAASTTTSTISSVAKQASAPVANAAKSTPSVAATPSLPAQAVNHVLRMNPGLARTTMLREVLASWVRQNPPAAAQFAQTMTDGPDKQTAMQLVADQWEAVDPTAAMNWLTSLPQDMEAQNLYTAMAEKWASEDHPQPAE
jgi:hypothetical protein